MLDFNNDFTDDDQLFSELSTTADQLLDCPSARRLPLLRNQAKNLGLSLRDRELEDLLRQARREREGQTDENTKGETEGERGGNAKEARGLPCEQAACVLP